MIDARKVCTALSALATSKIPEIAHVYVEIAPPEPQYPGLLIAVKSWETVDSALDLIQVEAKLTLTVLQSGEATPDEILSLRQKVVDLFRMGFLRVDGRALATSTQMGGEEQKAEQVSVSLAFFDDRKEPEEELPVMETINTTMDLKG